MNEELWKGKFGDEYIARNSDLRRIYNKTALFAKILSRTTEIRSVIEFGAGEGYNLIALRNLIPLDDMSAVEINGEAVEQLMQIPHLNIYHGSILDFFPYPCDLAFTFNVLIHIEPDKLKDVYRRIYDCSSRYILFAEYYNPSPVMVPYRGYNNALFKRDFAGELMDNFPVELVDYGFQYHRDVFPADDVTWFLMRKND